MQNLRTAHTKPQRCPCKTSAGSIQNLSDGSSRVIRNLSGPKGTVVDNFLEGTAPGGHTKPQRDRGGPIQNLSTIGAGPYKTSA